jgi:catechol 2,3-dioxygenase-like lactoylglutathione lyase family enzyme
MPITKIVPIIQVTDMQRALDFYCSSLGFICEFGYPVPLTGPAYVGLSLDGHEIHLSSFGGPAVGGTATYLYLDDVDTLFSRLRRAGLKTPGDPDSPVEEGPVDQTWGMREFAVRDPDGNKLIFGSPVPHPGG